MKPCAQSDTTSSRATKETPKLASEILKDRNGASARTHWRHVPSSQSRSPVLVVASSLLI